MDELMRPTDTTGPTCLVQRTRPRLWNHGWNSGRRQQQLSESHKEILEIQHAQLEIGAGMHRVWKKLDQFRRQLVRAAATSLPATEC
jgi:hypothetical protein